VSGLRDRLTGRLTDAGYAAGWGLVRGLPEPAARGLFEGGARWAAWRGGARSRQLRANLRVVTGGRLSEAELDALTARALSSYARYWREAFRLPTLGVDRVVAGTVLPGVESIAKAYAAGRGVIMVLPHSGNWDAAGVWMAHWLGGPFLTVVERLRPESLYRRFLEYRETLGFRVVPHTGGERPSSAVLREWLADGGVVCLLVDRDLGRTGVPVTFFGRTTTMPGGPAVLADQTGAALIPAVCQFAADGWQVLVHPEVSLDGAPRLRDRVTGAMQGVAAAFETSIAERPEDWHMLGRQWPDVGPDPERH
jgi:phosphatidylinositol dimannoside acyltransferase